MAYDISRRSFKSTFSPNGDHPTPSKSDESLSKEMNDGTHPETISLHPGNVRFLELDAEQLYPHFPPNSYDLVWISEVLSHLPEKARFFRNAHAVLRPVRTSSSNLPSSPSLSSSGRLVIADWFKDLSSTPAQYEADILPIEKGMLLPPLASMEDYCEMAKNAGFELVGDVLDISDKVAKTWSVTSSLPTMIVVMSVLQGYLALPHFPFVLRPRILPRYRLCQFPPRVSGDEEGVREWCVQICGAGI